MPQRRDHITAARLALSGRRWPVTEAPDRIPRTAGLYAIYGDHDAWGDLGYDYRADTPLYIGKSEGDLVDRDLRTHFAVDTSKPARTGSSTVRRSFAALLRDRLNLRAVPRNPAKPGYFSHYALTPEADDRLTAWMHAHLSIAVWPAPTELNVTLKTLETAMLAAFDPLLNLTNTPNPSPRLKAARKVMAAEARESAQPVGESGIG